MTKSFKILVVDDMKDVRTTLAGVLADRGYLVKSIGTENEALSAVEEEYFDFIIIDVRLRGHDDADASGMELAGKIRSFGIKSQIILTTGLAVKGYHFRRAIEYGIFEYIEKGENWMDDVCRAIGEANVSVTEDNLHQEFDVFLCHNSEDKKTIKEIGNKLLEQNIKPWLDIWELRPGLPWQDIVEEQIEEIKSAAVFVGESGLGPWQEMEIRGLLSEFVKRKCPVIPVILSNAPKKPRLPLFLREMTWVDFRKKVPDPMNQLIWGITGQRD
jgi:ActR/RegA family two-component response regulator